MHFPYCKRKCAYCAFTSSADYSTKGAYLHRLKTEISSRAQNESISTLYFGGGTPSTLTGGYLTEVYNLIAENFCVDRLEEFTVECNPDSVTEEFLSECKNMGVTRLSVGLQSVNDDVLKAVGRVHDVKKFVSAIDLIKQKTSCDVSSDIIIGLPGEQEGDVKNAIALLDELGVEHISLYSLTVEEGTPLYESGYTPDEDAQADGYEKAVAELKSRGYVRYEVSNFAKNGKIAKHNYKYWTGADYYGFGAAAHSLVCGVRYANANDVSDYIRGSAPVETTYLTQDDKREEFVMLGLRTCDGVDLARYEALTGKRLTDEKSAEIKKLLSYGLIEVTDTALKATDKGVYLLNSIITELI